MSRIEAWLVHVATILVGGTGVMYAWLRYGLRVVDPGPISGSLGEPIAQHLHILAAPLMIFAVGLIWRRHAWSRWRRRVLDRRSSGLSLIAMLAPMVISGYLLETATVPLWHRIWVWVHLSTSALWLAAYLVHQLTVVEPAGD